MAPDFTDSDREPDETDGSNKMHGASRDVPSGPVDGALDVIDRSIGMYVLRRLTGRSSKAASKADAPVVLTADQIAQRIGIAAAAPAERPERSEGPPPVVVGVAATTTAAGRATAAPKVPPRSQGSAAEVGPELDRLTRGPTTTVAATSRAASAPRERLVRDSGVALLVLAVVGLAVAMWPQGGQTEEPAGSVFVVDRAVVTPDPSDEVEAPTAATAVPTGEVAVETDVPVLTPEATVTPGGTPKPPAVVDPASRTPRPVATPTRRPTPTPTAKPTATPGSTPTATPTPDPTPTPTPAPTPTPDPTPTPTPTPMPTPTPTPTPAP